MTGQTGWVALAGQIVGTVEEWHTEWNWDGQFHLTKREAIKAGYPLANDTDDFNLGKVENGRLVWFGWMENEHPTADWTEVAQYFGWSAPEARC
jgi:hypothetical protein